MTMCDVTASHTYYQDKTSMLLAHDFFKALLGLGIEEKTQLWQRYKLGFTW